MTFATVEEISARLEPLGATWTPARHFGGALVDPSEYGHVEMRYPGRGLVVVSAGAGGIVTDRDRTPDAVAVAARDAAALDVAMDGIGRRQGPPECWEAHDGTRMRAPFRLIPLAVETAP